MSNKTTLQSNNALISQNNTDLQALIDTANALPEAGGGGTTVETCTVTINAKRLSYGTSILLGYCATQFINGSISVTYHAPTTTVISQVGVQIENVVCGSAIAVKTSRTVSTMSNVSGGDSEILSISSDGLSTFLKAPTTPADAVFNLYND